MTGETTLLAGEEKTSRLNIDSHADHPILYKGNLDVHKVTQIYACDNASFFVTSEGKLLSSGIGA